MAAKYPLVEGSKFIPPTYVVMYYNDSSNQDLYVRKVSTLYFNQKFPQHFIIS